MQEAPRRERRQRGQKDLYLYRLPDAFESQIYVKRKRFLKQVKKIIFKLRHLQDNNSD